MKWAIIVLSLLFLSYFPGSAHAQVAGRCFHFKVTNKTVSTSAIEIAPVNSGRCSVSIRVENAVSMRCTEGSGPFAATPTSSVGWPLDNSYIGGFENSIEQILCIRSGASDATVSVMEWLP
jgi:hypothetical protein